MLLTRLALALFVMLATTSAVAAHGVWTAERWGEVGLIYGYGAEDSPYDPSKVRSVAGIDAQGGPVEVTLRSADNHATLLVGDNRCGYSH